MVDLFYKPPPQAIYDRTLQKGFFIRPEDIPDYAEKGFYNPVLFVTSYVIVVIAAYVALGIAANLSGLSDKSNRIKLVCGAFAMGAGIWSMHFIGMLAYEMDMKLVYEPFITGLSMVVAILFAGMAFMMVQRDQLQWRTIAVAAPVLGLAVCGMHYMGMAAMRMDATIHYMPGLFFLSFLIAAGASAGALWFIFHARHSRHPVFFKVIAALIMGVAVCGMHYTGMAASVFLPFADCRYGENDLAGLAWSITLITSLIIAIAYLVKKLDEALAETQARTMQLLQAQKMEAIGQLTGGFAHDFNNILAVVRGNLELIERTVPPDPKTAMFIKTALDGIERGRNLTQRLLAFSRKQTLQPVSTDINALVQSILSYASRALGTQIQVVQKLASGLPPVMIDPAQLETAVLNLALNARDAMANGGRLTVRTALLMRDEIPVVDSNLPPGPYVALTVEDTGTGMAPEVLEHATEPFFTTKEAGRGSGMGLSMVFGFVRQSGGHLQLESKVGLGSQITLYLPARPVSEKSARNNLAAQIFRKKPQNDDIPGGAESVLVVDDEEEIRNVLHTTLTGLGYRVVTASNGSEGLGVLRSRPEIKAIISDIVMPGGMNGYQMAEEALARRPDLGIVFISGFSRDQEPPPALEKSSYIYLAKPYSLKDLAEALRKVLDSRIQG